MSGKGLKLAIPLAAAVVLAGTVAGFAAGGGHKSTATTAAKAAPTAYAVSSALKGRGATGTFAGDLTTATRSLAWKLLLKPRKVATRAVLQVGTTATGAVVAKLCAPCAVGAHGTARLSAAAFKLVVAGRAGVAVTAKGIALRGALKAAPAKTPPAAGGASLNITPTPALVAQGKAAAESLGCQGCHTIDGTDSTGPTWKRLAGSKVHLADGTTTVATDSYLYGVITDPSTLNVEGFDSGVMAEVIPPGAVSPAQAKAIVAFIKTLK